VAPLASGLFRRQTAEIPCGETWAMMRATSLTS
jgi:hypothetical protein